MENSFVHLPSGGSIVFRGDPPMVAVGGATALHEAHTTFVPAVRPDTPHDQQTMSVPQPIAGGLTVGPYPHHAGFLPLEAAVVFCATGTGAVALREYLRGVQWTQTLPW
jgi:hypothetical protein